MSNGVIGWAWGAQVHQVYSHREGAAAHIHPPEAEKLSVEV